MERYAKYKDSGVDWIGEIPEGWRVVRNKYLGFIRARLGWKGLKAEEYVDDGYPMFSAFNCVEGNLRPTPVTYISQERYDESPEIMLTKGDILLVKDGAGIGKYAVVRELGKPSTVNGSLAVISPNSIIDSRYLGYFYASIQFQDYIHLLMDGMGVPHLFQRDLKQVFVPVPPLKDQQAIANYLDEKTTAIDAAVANVKRSIELLNEYRQSVISEAVTKGLDHNSPMKNSGIEWIGEIPERWHMLPLKRLASFLPGYAFKSDDFTLSGSIRLLRGINVGVGSIRWDDSVYVKRETVEDLDEYLLSTGDILVGLDRPWIQAGMRVAQVDNESAGSYLVQRVAKITPKKDTLIPDFLVYLFRTNIFTESMDSTTTGVSVPHISTGQLGEVIIPCPPISEQQSIAEMLDNMTQSIDSLIAQKQSLLVRLKEYRSSLISECMTGKVRVPGVEA